MRIMASDGNNSSDALSNRGLLNDNEVLNIISLGDVGAAAELNTGLAPFRIFDILGNIFKRIAKGDDSDRVRVSLAKDSTKTRDFVSLGQRHVLSIYWDTFLDPVIADALNFDQLRDRNRLAVRKVESKFSRSNEGTLLVNVVAKDFSKGKVENMGTGVVVPDRPSTKLVVSADYFVSDLDITLLHPSNVQHITIVNLNILHLKLSLAIDSNHTSVILLTTRLSVEVGSVEQNTKCSIGRKLRSGVEELGAMIDALDASLDVIQI